MSDPGTIRWIMFDWGNVICDYRPQGFPKLAEHLGVPLDPLVEAMGADNWLERLCDGSGTPQAFMRWLERRFGRSVHASEICEMFAADVEERLPGVDELVMALWGRYDLAILSNTFFGHWAHLTSDPFYSLFDVALGSHLLGAVKPDPRIFERALAELRATPEEVVFFDDGATNVEAAQALGMHAVHATDVSATFGGLRRLGLL